MAVHSTAESDRLLIQQIRLGGQATADAWEELVNRYEGRLRAFVRSRLRDQSVLDDVVQETFIGFLNSLTNYDDKRALQTWLFTIASHKITDQLRKQGRRRYQAGNDADEEMMQAKTDDKQRAASSIARNHEREEIEIAAITQALQEITADLQQKQDFIRIQVLELLFVKGWPNYKVAQHLSVTEQQVANYRYGAVKKISEHIQAKGLNIDVFPELHQA